MLGSEIRKLVNKVKMTILRLCYDTGNRSVSNLHVHVTRCLFIFYYLVTVDRRRNCEIGPHLKDSKNTDFVKDIYGSASVSSHSLAEIEQSSDAEHFSMFFMEKEVKKSCEGEFIRVSVSTPLEFTLDYVKCGGGFC